METYDVRQVSGVITVYASAPAKGALGPPPQVSTLISTREITDLVVSLGPWLFDPAAKVADPAAFLKASLFYPLMLGHTVSDPIIGNAPDTVDFKISRTSTQEVFSFSFSFGMPTPP